MTNGEKYKTAKERYVAFNNFCDNQKDYCEDCPIFDFDGQHCDRFAWLDLEYKDRSEAEKDKPMPCPFCGGGCEVVELPEEVYYVVCDHDDICTYCGGQGKTEAEAIAAHNRVCKAVAAYKESEAAK